MRLGLLIGAYLKEHNVTLRAIAQEVGVDHATIHRMVHGEPVRMDVLIKFLAWIISPPAK